MGKIPEAEARLFKNIFVCKKCKTRVKATMTQILKGEIRCKKCGSKRFKPKRKK